jgi:hypothetical protein
LLKMVEKSKDLRCLIQMLNHEKAFNISFVLVVTFTRGVIILHPRRRLLPLRCQREAPLEV